MSAKPLRNSKGVNKPFRSPFSIPQNSKNKSNTNTPESSRYETPLNVSIAKRLLFEASPSPKKLRLSKEDDEQKSQLCQTDLIALRKRVQEKDESVKSLKTTLSYKKKNKAEDLENAITQWTECCQKALRDYQRLLQEKNGQPIEMLNILSSFNIESDIVRYSIDEDTFY